MKWDILKPMNTVWAMVFSFALFLVASPAGATPNYFGMLPAENASQGCNACHSGATTKDSLNELGKKVQVAAPKTKEDMAKLLASGKSAPKQAAAPAKASASEKASGKAAPKTDSKPVAAVKPSKMGKLVFSVSGKKMSAPGSIVNGRALVSARDLASALGVEVDFDSKKKEVIMRSPAFTVSLATRTKTAIVNGKSKTLDVGARLVDNKAFLPLRFVAEAFGNKVQYDMAAGISIDLLSAGLTINNTGAFAPPAGLDNAPATKITLFYPGQASWEFLTSSKHPGSQAILSGTGCLTCHKGQEAKLGERLVKTGPLENNPIQGKDSTVDLSVKAAYDDQYFYLQAQWNSAEPGGAHNLLRFDGKKWVKYGGPKPDVQKKGFPPSYEDRLTIILGDTNIPAYDGAKVGFQQVGCFQTCHNSMRAMPLEPTLEEVKNDPYFGDKGKKREDIRKYLLITRKEVDETGGWNKLKEKAELDALFAQGQFLDLWQARGGRSLPVGFAGDDFVFEYRNFDKGTKNPFADLLSAGQPKYMYDKNKTGFSAISGDNWRDVVNKNSLIVGRTAVPYDPAAGFKAGDILPQQYLQTPDGSRADVQTVSEYSNGKWTVTLRRKLNTGNPDDKVLASGKVYTTGLSIFDDYVSNRRHFVSFPVTLGLGENADIKAVPLK